MDHESVAVIVIDNEGWQKLITNEDTATTLVAVTSEDPADWSEMVACWPRFTTRVVPEFASSLAIEFVDRVAALEAVGAADSCSVRTTKLPDTF